MYIREKENRKGWKNTSAEREISRQRRSIQVKRECERIRDEERRNERMKITNNTENEQERIKDSDRESKLRLEKNKQRNKQWKYSKERARKTIQSEGKVTWESNATLINTQRESETQAITVVSTECDANAALRLYTSHQLYKATTVIIEILV